jgi:hypothetical protein
MVPQSNLDLLYDGSNGMPIQADVGYWPFRDVLIRRMAALRH